MPTPIDQAAPSENGSLVNRVQQLRLSNQLGAGSGSGPSRGAWLPWVLCGMMAVAWAGVGVRSYKTSGSASDGGGPGVAPPPPSGGTAPPGGAGPAAKPGELLLQIKGTVTPYAQITLSPIDVAGEILEINFKEGDQVFADKTVLAKIRDSRYRNDATTAEAALAAADAQLARASATEAATKSRVKKAESARAAAAARVTKTDASVTQTGKEFARMEKTPSTVQSDKERDDASAKKDIAIAEKVAADADLKAAGAEIEAAQADERAATQAVRAAEADRRGAEARKAEADRILRNCSIIAPIDGTILTKSVEKGSLVSPTSFNVASGICTMADLSQLEIEIDVPERQIKRVVPGLDCVVQADADPTRNYRGVVDRIMPIADDTKNVVRVRIRVFLPTGETPETAEKPGSLLKPRMSVVATIYNRPFAFDEKRDQPWGGPAMK